MSGKELWYGIAFLLLLGAIMCALVIFTFGHNNSNALVNPPLFPTVSREDLRKSMRYHGIIYAFQEEGGKWRFNRAGQRCDLFAYRERR